MSATISLLFGLLVAIVVLATLATRLRVPYAILLVLGGLLLGFVPGLPSITLNPELILVLFLPPPIYSSAWLTSWREFRANLRPILQLALGLVLVTTIVIAIVAHTIAGLSWPVASRFFSSNTRLQANAVWNVLVFLLNGLVFLLIGLQLRSILDAIAGRSLLTLIWQALLISLTVIAVRIAWVFPAASLPRLVSPRLRGRDPYPGWRHVRPSPVWMNWPLRRGSPRTHSSTCVPTMHRNWRPSPKRWMVLVMSTSTSMPQSSSGSSKRYSQPNGRR
jgi:NhaP-type Na+/H+ or K+/H+ antiporter